MDPDGTVYVRTPDGGERPVGSWQAGDAHAGLEHFAIRYADRVVEVELMERRLDADGADPKAIRSQAAKLRKLLSEDQIVGDLAALDARLQALIESAGVHEERAAERRRQRKQQAIAAKEALVAEAEQIAAAEGNWKAGGDRLRTIVEDWRAIKGVDRQADDALWHRFRAARDTFIRNRGSHFAQLDQQRDQVRVAKEKLVVEAEKLAESTEWGPAASRLKSLMAEWKATGRAQRSADDALWQRFRNAQDRFFTARSEAFGARDAEERRNREAKEAIIAEVEALDSERDPAGAQNALRTLQERYDAVGHVPREAIGALDTRMRAAEQRTRSAGSAIRPPAPENPLLVKMRETVERAEDALARARNAGDQDRIAEAEAALEARRTWLRDAERAGR